jgi:hypothetical protein
MPKQVVAIRIDPELLSWTNSYASSYGWDRTRLVTEMLVALKEGRLHILPRAGVSPFPVHEVEPGSTAECPALISFTPEIP